MLSVVLIVDYFGQWPEWFPIYLESCRANPTIHWSFHTDCDCDIPTPSNVELRKISLTDYVQQVSTKLGVKFRPIDTYKLCDLRPAYGVLYEEEIRGFDFFGYTDIDLIYGDIRSFYTDDILAKYDTFSTHPSILSGHLALLRNTEDYRQAFRRIKEWRSFLEDGRSRRFDEDVFSRVFRHRLPWYRRPLLDPLDRVGVAFKRRRHFCEQYTTPLLPGPWIDGNPEHPTTWYWKDGKITNSQDAHREFIYFHFMNFKLARCLNPAYGSTPFWAGAETLVHLAPEEIAGGVRIDRAGFHAVTPVSAIA